MAPTPRAHNLTTPGFRAHNPTTPGFRVHTLTAHGSLLGTRGGGAAQPTHTLGGWLQEQQATAVGTVGSGGPLTAHRSLLGTGRGGCPTQLAPSLRHHKRHILL